MTGVRPKTKAVWYTKGVCEFDLRVCRACNTNVGKSYMYWKEVGVGLT